MRLNNIEVRVLVKGRPITTYPHNGKVFVEGRAGSEFEIEVRNNNPFRVEAIVSVDGLSVTDGKDAGYYSNGYLVEAHGTVVIPGWMLDQKTVAAFTFAGKGKSYAAQSTGSSRNTGVIGVIAIREKITQPVYRPMIQTFGAMKGSTGDAGWMNNMPRRVSTGGPIYASSSAMGMNTIGVSATMSGASLGYSDDAQITYDSFSTQNLGTEFGQATEFRTTATTFERGDVQAIMALYYDDARGLKQRGIKIDRRTRRDITEEPQAFPAIGCKPPSGWNG